MAIWVLITLNKLVYLHLFTVYLQVYLQEKGLLRYSKGPFLYICKFVNKYIVKLQIRRANRFSTLIVVRSKGGLFTFTNLQILLTEIEYINCKLQFLNIVPIGCIIITLTNRMPKSMQPKLSSSAGSNHFGTYK